jgi:hypothetical protein
MSAGVSVTATTRPTRIVSAMPGPNPRNSADSATTSDAVPAATVMPATATIGENWPIDVSAARRRPAPTTSWWRSPERKKIEQPAEGADDAERDDDRDPCRQQGEDGGDDGAERQPDDEQDRRDGCRLHQRQGVLHEVRLLGARGDGAGDADVRVGRVVDELLGQALGVALLAGEARARVAEQVGDDGRVALARARERATGVGERQRSEDRRVVAALRHGDGPEHRLGLGVEGQAGGVALHDRDPADQRQPEDLEGPQLRRDRRVLGAAEGLEVAAAGTERWQPGVGGVRGDDPQRDDDVAQPDDGTRVRRPDPAPPPVVLPSAGAPPGRDPASSGRSVMAPPSSRCGEDGAVVPAGAGSKMSRA